MPSGVIIRSLFPDDDAAMHDVPAQPGCKNMYVVAIGFTENDQVCPPSALEASHGDTALGMFVHNKPTHVGTVPHVTNPPGIVDEDHVEPPLLENAATPVAAVELTMQFPVA